MFFVCVIIATLASLIGVFNVLLRDRRSAHARPMPSGIFLAAAAYASIDGMGYLPGISDDARAILGGVALTAGSLFIAGAVREVARASGIGGEWAYRAVQGALLLCALVGLVPRLSYSTDVTPRTISLVGAVYYDAAPTIVGIVAFGVCFGALLVVFGRLAMEVRRGRPSAGYHAFGFAVLCLAVLSDITVVLGHSPLPYLLPSAILVSGVSFSAAVVRQIIRDRRSLEELRSELEVRVADRTRELEQRSDQLARAERLATVGRLASGIAHELNNPAAAIRASLEDAKLELLRQPANPELRACIDISLAAVERVGRIVRQLGAMAGDAAATDRVRVGTSLGSAVRLAVAAAHDASPEIAVRTDIEAALFVRGMAAALEEAVTAVLLNAVEAIPEGREGRVEVTARLEDGGVTLSIRDNGVGMTDAVAVRAFEPFYTTKELGRASGLGLSVAKGLIETMGGTIALRSIAGVGTEVTMRLQPGEAPENSGPARLPAARVDARQMATPPASDGAAAPSQPFARADVPVAPVTAPSATRRLRVLVVDDDDLVRVAMQRYLARHYDVTLAGTVEAGLAKATRECDVILSDVVMPDGGGQRLFLELVARDAELAERVIFMTGGAFRGDVENFLRTQAQPVLNKPVRLSELQAAIARLAVATE